MYTRYNYFGFTKGTESLICGVGGGALIKEFIKRDISTDVLHKLTKEDFITLGANEDLAEKMFNTLHISKEKDPVIKLKPYQSISDKITILEVGRKQVDIIEAFITYSKLRLQKERINSFIDPDKALTASKVLCFATDSILNEVNEAELKLKELEAVIMSRSRKYSYISYCISIGGLCVATYILFDRIWK